MTIRRSVFGSGTAFPNLVAICTFATLLYGATAVAAADQQPDLHELVATIPFLSSTNSQLESFELTAEMHGGGHGYRFHIEAAFAKPDRLSLYVADAETRTPIFFSAERQALTYNPVEQAIFVISRATPQLLLRGTDSGLKFNFSPNVEENSGIEIDITSLVEINQAKRYSPETSRGHARYLLPYGSKGATQSLAFDFNSDFPLTYLAIHPSENTEETAFEIKNISINKPINPHLRTFPARDKIPPHLLDNTPGDEPLSVASSFDYARVVLMAPIARGGVLNPDNRSKPYLEDVDDWDILVEADKAVRPLLQEMLQLPTQKVQ